MEIVLDCMKCEKEVTKFCNQFSKDFLKTHAWNINYHCFDCDKKINKYFIKKITLNEQDK